MADEFMVKYWESVGFDGLGPLAFDNAIRQCQSHINPDIIHCLFPNQPRDLLVYTHQFADSISIEAMENASEIKGVRAIIHYTIMARLRYFAPFRPAVKSMVFYLAQPQNLPLAGKLLGHSADIIWRLAGDTSHDFNYYTKRGLLMGVMQSLIPLYLHDSTDDLSDTAQFLANRLDNVVDIGKLLHQNFGNYNFIEKMVQKSQFFMRSSMNTGKK